MKHKAKSITRKISLLALLFMITQPTAHADWRNSVANAWNTLLGLKKEHIIIGTGVVLTAAALYWLGTKKPPITSMHQSGLQPQQPTRPAVRPPPSNLVPLPTLDATLAQVQPVIKAMGAIAQHAYTINNIVQQCTQEMYSKQKTLHNNTASMKTSIESFYASARQQIMIQDQQITMLYQQMRPRRKALLANLEKLKADPALAPNKKTIERALDHINKTRTDLQKILTNTEKNIKQLAYAITDISKTISTLAAEPLNVTWSKEVEADEEEATTERE